MRKDLDAIQMSVVNSEFELLEMGDLEVEVAMREQATFDAKRNEMRLRIQRGYDAAESIRRRQNRERKQSQVEADAKRNVCINMIIMYVTTRGSLRQK